eukprot:8478431-Pyramimonas_sp.AAC.1
MEPEPEQTEGVKVGLKVEKNNAVAVKLLVEDTVEDTKEPEAPQNGESTSALPCDTSTLPHSYTHTHISPVLQPTSTLPCDTSTWPHLYKQMSHLHCSTHPFFHLTQLRHAGSLVHTHTHTHTHPSPMLQPTSALPSDRLPAP